MADEEGILRSVSNDDLAMWLSDKIDEYDALGAISEVEVETFHQLLQWVTKGTS